MLFDVTKLLEWEKDIVFSFFVPALHGSCPSSLFLVLVTWGDREELLCHNHGSRNFFQDII